MQTTRKEKIKIKKRRNEKEGRVSEDAKMF